MITVTICGSSNQILKVRDALNQIYKSKYNSRVQEEIPEAVQWGATNCTASFFVDDNYLDFSKVWQYPPEMIITTGVWKVIKPKKSFKCKWVRCTKEESYVR